jgi:hypothetical protein
MVGRSAAAACLWCRSRCISDQHCGAPTGCRRRALRRRAVPATAFVTSGSAAVCAARLQSLFSLRCAADFQRHVQCRVLCLLRATSCRCRGGAWRQRRSNMCVVLPAVTVSDGRSGSWCRGAAIEPGCRRWIRRCVSWGACWVWLAADLRHARQGRCEIMAEACVLLGVLCCRCLVGHRSHTAVVLCSEQSLNDVRRCAWSCGVMHGQALCPTA